MKLDRVLAIAADESRMARPASALAAPRERIATDLDRMVSRQLAMRQVTRADMDAAALRYQAAEDLAAEFGTDVSEWTV